MSDLVKELKHEHMKLADALNKAKELGIGTPEGKAALFSAKELLLAHLKKEDEQLYPVLRKKAATDEKLQRTLETFASEMDTVTKAALEFFRKYARGGSGIEFGMDFERLFAVLTQRIGREENIIYTRYDV